MAFNSFLSLSSLLKSDNNGGALIEDVEGTNTVESDTRGVGISMASHGARPRSFLLSFPPSIINNGNQQLSLSVPCFPPLCCFVLIFPLSSPPHLCLLPSPQVHSGRPILKLVHLHCAYTHMCGTLGDLDPAPSCTYRRVFQYPWN